jgi:phenylacetate-CoA ligase
MSFQSQLLRNLILPLGDRLFGQRMMARLKYLETAQYWPTEKILTKQAEALQKLIHIAYAEVPFYHDLMERSGIKPDEIRIPTDLSKLPIVTKDMLREGYPAQTTRAIGQKTYQATTSGSTGKNFYVLEDAETAGWYRASFMLSLEWAGWQIGEPHLQTGMTLHRSLDRRVKDWLLGCHYYSAYQLDDKHLDAILEEIESAHLNHLWGYPGSLFLLAQRAEQMGWRRPLKSIVSWGDSLYKHYRKEIEAVFQTKAFDAYGVAEGVQIAAQCEYGHYHLHALDAVVEFLDDQGQPVQPGEVGNIVVTRLHPGPMPLIRYAIGDLGVPSAQESCPCGRGFLLMDSIQGRDADVIVTPSGNRLIVHFFTGILEHFPEIDSFQIVQEEPQSILVRIQPITSITENALNRIRSALAEKGAADLVINFEILEEIPLPPTGKHRFVISHISNKEDPHD